MATFPGAVKAFTTKNDGAGNTIFASHVNDLQDEVAAIEDGLRNGTAPLNSSNSTFNGLSVTGNSTLTGSLVCSSLVSAPNQPRCSAYHSATQVVSSASTSALTLNSEDYDVGNLHSTVTTPTRITVPAGSSGLYLALGQSHATCPSTSNIRLYIRKNGTDVVVDQQSPVSTGLGILLHPQTVLFLDGTDYVELAGAAQADAVTFGNAVSAFATRLTIAKLS